MEVKELLKQIKKEEKLRKLNNALFKLKLIKARAEKGMFCVRDEAWILELLNGTRKDS